MSLVTTAICRDSRRRLHRASTSAVFPEPTGPPTPTRSVSLRGAGFSAFAAALLVDLAVELAGELAGELAIVCALSSCIYDLNSRVVLVSCGVMAMKCIGAGV